MSKKEKKKLVPKLRFPEFEGEWEKKRLEELTFKISDGIHSTPKYSSDGEYYFVNGNNLTDGKIEIKKSTKKVSKKEFEKHKRILGGNTILLSINGTIGNIAEYNNEKIILGKSACYINVDQGKANRKFVKYTLSTERVGMFFLSEMTGSTIKNLSLKTIKNTIIYLPPLKEQQKIVQTLTSLDNLIAAHNEKLDALETHKKGLLQQLFPAKGEKVPKLRFPEFEEEWNKMELRECLKYLQPTPYLVEKTDYDERYLIPVLTAGKTFILGYTKERNGIFDKQLPVIIFDDFTTASKIVNFPFKLKSSAIKILYANNLNCTKFMYELMQTITFEVSTHKRHWISVYSSISVFIPKIEEQKKLAQTFTSLDNIIAAYKEKIQVLETHKKGLLQQLFPSI